MPQNHDQPTNPAWVQLCATSELDPRQRMDARLAILSNPQAQDCTLYRADEQDEDAEEDELGDARILFVGPFQAPESWGETERAEFFDDCDPALFCTAYIECVAPVGGAGFFLPEVGDLCASMTAAGEVVMYFVHDCSEQAQGRLCVLIRDDEPLF